MKNSHRASKVEAICLQTTMMLGSAVAPEQATTVMKA